MPQARQGKLAPDVEQAAGEKTRSPLKKGGRSLGRMTAGTKNATDGNMGGSQPQTHYRPPPSDRATWAKLRREVPETSLYPPERRNRSRAIEATRASDSQEQRSKYKKAPARGKEPTERLE